MQKWVTTDFLNHTLRKNEGQVEQYYVENLHPTNYRQGNLECSTGGVKTSEYLL